MSKFRKILIFGTRIFLKISQRHTSLMVVKKFQRLFDFGNINANNHRFVSKNLDPFLFRQSGKQKVVWIFEITQHCLKSFADYDRCTRALQSMCDVIVGCNTTQFFSSKWKMGYMEESENIYLWRYATDFLHFYHILRKNNGLLNNNYLDDLVITDEGHSRGNVSQLFFYLGYPLTIFIKISTTIMASAKVSYRLTLKIQVKVTMQKKSLYTTRYYTNDFTKLSQNRWQCGKKNVKIYQLTLKMYVKVTVYKNHLLVGPRFKPRTASREFRVAAPIIQKTFLFTFGRRSPRSASVADS